MDRHILTREGDYSLFLREFPKENIFLTHYMLSTRWLEHLYGLGHYVILPRAVSHILVMNKNNVITLGDTYAKRRFNKFPEFFYKISHSGLLNVWIPS